MEDKDKPKKEKQHQQKELTQNPHRRFQGLSRKTLPRTKTLEKNKYGSGILPSSSSAASVSSMQGSKVCSIGSIPSSSSSSSQLKKPCNEIVRKPKFVSENAYPKKHLPAKSQNESAPQPSSVMSSKKPLLLHQMPPGKKPTSKFSQRWKLSAGSSNPLKNRASGSERAEQVLVESSDSFTFTVPDKLVGIENATPVGKLLCGPSLNFANVDDDKHVLVGEDTNSADTSVKTTPPVEASVSPEIQSGAYAAAVATSTVTPICYGAGHLISGVTDKRKCRSRGVLTVRNPSDSLGFAYSNSCEDDVNENADNVLFKSRNSLIPLPAEASVNWSSSPLSKEVQLQKCDLSDSSTPLVLDSISVSSSISSFCQLSADLVSDDSSEKDGYEHPGAITSCGKTRIVSGCQEFLELSSEERDLDLSVTPQAKCVGATACLPKGGGCSHNFIGKKSPTFLDVLSNSKIVQTPSSNASSENQVSFFRRETQGKKSNLDQVVAAQDCRIASLSPEYQTSMWHPPVLNNQLSHSASPSDLIDVIKSGMESEACASWISDSSLDNTSLTHMRISWREGLASQTSDLDELDCCICLSDEENCDERSGLVLYKPFQACGIENSDSIKIEGLRSPEFLEQEPEFLRKGRKNLSPVGPNIFAESISTDSSGPLASVDSDWGLCNQNHLYLE